VGPYVGVGFGEERDTGAEEGAPGGTAASLGPHLLHVCLQISPKVEGLLVHLDSFTGNRLLSMSQRLRSDLTHSQMDVSVFLIGTNTHSSSSAHTNGAENSPDLCFG